jgi:ADP-ribose pyrophosphatase YjhB (NUDIX family)
MIILQVGVKAFLRNQEGKYLLLRRNPEKYKDVKGSWDIVGGRINPGSSLFENLKREVAEETKLKIVSEPKLIAAQDILHRAGKHVVRLTYVATAIGDVVIDIAENTEFKWLTIEELRVQDELDVFVKELVDSCVVS